jgi:hypothetical protein
MLNEPGMCSMEMYQADTTAACQGTSRGESLDVAIQESNSFRKVAEAEMSRTYALLDKHFKSVTLEA